MSLELNRVSKTYPGEVPVRALRDVSITIAQGDYVAIVGPSGSGKSTLLNQIALLDTPTSGEYFIQGEGTATKGDAERARTRSSTFAFVFQSFHLLEGRSVVDNVAIGMLYRRLPAGRRRERGRDALSFVGLADKSERHVEKLSGGERQRVAIARAIASGAPVIVADEPTGNLDSKSGELVMDTLGRLNRSGATVIVVTHDPEVADRAVRKLHVSDGQVTELVTESGDRTETGKVPVPEGQDSKVRFLELVSDAWTGMWVRTWKTLALVLAVALGVGLGLATLGLSETAKYQVADIFDAQRNSRVVLTSPANSQGALPDPDLTAEESLQRLKSLAGVKEAAIFATHENRPLTNRLDSSAAESAKSVPVVGVVGGQLPAALASVDTGRMGFTESDSGAQLADRTVFLGIQAAEDLNVGPLAASPIIWVEGEPWLVAGIVTDAGLQASLLSSVIMSEPEAAKTSLPLYSSVEIAVLPGAAQQVATQAPLAWAPTAPESISVDAPPDPTLLRGEIETNLSIMLQTLTGVALLVAVLSLANSMTTAVMQRTGEFGLRRALGARRIHIRGLVLTESLAIGAIGGLAGAYLSILAILAVTIARSWQPVIEPSSILFGITGGILVGLLGGIIATHKSSKIEPQDALRA